MATGIVREIVGWTEDLSIFSPGRVISFHFDNASDTLISLDDSNRVMIHHSTDFAGTSEELKPSFDQEFSEAIRQVLGNTGHTQLLVSSSLKDTLWTISSNNSLITKTIEWENRGSFKWASHPSQSDKLVLLIGSVLHLYAWPTLNRLTGPQGILLELSRPSAADIRAIMPFFFFKNKKNYLATLFSDVTTRYCNLRGFLWNTSNFPEDSTSPFWTQPCCILDEGVRHLIGYYGRNLVYLTHDGWICSIGFHGGAPMRHFFLPADWLCANGELIIEVTAKGVLLLAIKDELAVIKRGHESRFETDPK